MPNFETNYAAIYVEAAARPTIDPAGQPTATINAVYIVSGYRGTNSWQASLTAAIHLRDSLTEAINVHTEAEV
ncbi:hypothetical protein [Streptomyces uncialis]|uniref:Uncharacterized protein n=1 Tax=Streptomyces uncialis TaxID=1048205 RepID=A0A1Q4VC94_9ACTN|nr:hypothetical protein [Streptomyces uncialis]OKH95433.1 hypothetical protein AB852_00815 [Streptomyces uncialis]